jgi:hypothetical protein
MKRLQAYLSSSLASYNSILNAANCKGKLFATASGMLNNSGTSSKDMDFVFNGHCNKVTEALKGK